MLKKIPGAFASGILFIKIFMPVTSLFVLLIKFTLTTYFTFLPSQTYGSKPTDREATPSYGRRI